MPAQYHFAALSDVPSITVRSTVTTLFKLSPNRVGLRLVAAVGLLLIMHVIAMQIIFNPDIDISDRLGLEYWHLSIFDLDEEESFGTWFSSGILLIASQLLWAKGRQLRAAKDSFASWWWALGLAFLVLSIDEVVGLHEMLNSLLDDTDWTVYGFAVLVTLALAYIPFLWNYRGRTAAWFIAAGAVYGGGAVGVEALTDADVNSLHYNMWTTLEEGMEMMGVVILIYFLLTVLRSDTGGDAELVLTSSSG
jgi:hypothetical protein